MSPRGQTAVPPLVHELEAEVMEEMWDRGEASVREVMGAINRRTKRERAYTTYMTIMARLYEKGALDRRREGRTDIYTPVHDRETHMALRAGVQVDSLVQQYGDAALSHFARQMASLDPARRRALARLARQS